MVLERSPGAKAGGWLMPAAVASLVALALTVIFWPVAALVRRHYRKPLPFAGREAKAYRWVRIGALASLVAIGAWLGISSQCSATSRCCPRRSTWLVLLHVLGTIAVFAGFALAVWHLSVVWKAKKRWLAASSGPSCSFLRRRLSAWIAIAYHLVGISTNY